MRQCAACSGSGYYDSHGSPPCGSCDGEGYIEASPEEHQTRLRDLTLAVSNALQRIPKDSSVYGDLKAAMELFGEW